jgi:hypothetical protein
LHAELAITVSRVFGTRGNMSPKNATRAELIAAAQRYIRDRKQLTEQQVAREKAIIGRSWRADRRDGQSREEGERTSSSDIRIRFVAADIPRLTAHRFLQSRLIS